MAAYMKERKNKIIYSTYQNTHLKIKSWNNKLAIFKSSVASATKENKQLLSPVLTKSGRGLFGKKEGVDRGCFSKGHTIAG